MKAILKSNGKEVDVELYSPTRYIETKASDSYGKTIFNADALIVTGAPVDWQEFRRNAARDFMSAIIVREAPQYDVACRNVATRVSEAIMWADELVKQLQKEG